MDSRRKSFNLKAGIIICLVIGIGVISSIDPSERPIMDQTTLRFSAARAYDTTREFVTQFPMRLFGSLESRQSTGYLTDKLASIGYEVEYIHFDGRTGGGQRAGRNVLAYKPGETDEIIVVTAHFDTARPTVQGAAKNGAAVGVLMELAELFFEENTRRSLLFVFTDGGEWGSTGVNDLLLNYEKKDRITAALTLDHVVPGDLAGFRLDTVGRSGVSAPRGFQGLARDVVKEQTRNVPVKLSRAEFLERAFPVSRSEHGQFLKMRIPAINLGSFSTDRLREKAILHSPEDTIENLKLETVDQYGRVAEQIVRSLAKSPEALYRSERRWTPSGIYGGIHQVCGIILFLVAMKLFMQIKKSRKILNFAQTGRELMAFFAVWIPFLILFSGIKLAYAARQFPFYDLYPAIAKDPVMQNPPWKIFAIIAASVLFVAVAVWVIARYFLREWTKPDYRNSCAALWGVLSVTIVLATVYNPFWGMVLFAAPGLLWSMPQIGKNADKKIFNTAYIASAAVPSCLATLWLAAQLGFGLNFFWYQTLALTTRLSSPAAYFMGTAVIAVGIRFMVISRFQKPIW